MFYLIIFQFSYLFRDLFLKIAISLSNLSFLTKWIATVHCFFQYSLWYWQFSWMLLKIVHFGIHSNGFQNCPNAIRTITVWHLMNIDGKPFNLQPKLHIRWMENPPCKIILTWKVSVIQISISLGANNCGQMTYILLIFFFKDCIPSKIWLLIRHGTRLPTANGLKRFSEMEKVHFQNKFDRSSKSMGEFLHIFSFVMKSLRMLPNWRNHHYV